MRTPCIAHRCTWCGKIQIGNGWRPERRLRPGLYSYTSCSSCRKIEAANREACIQKSEDPYFQGIYQGMTDWGLRL